MSLSKALTAAAGNAGGGALYVEDVFSTYVRTGTGDSPTITNDIDLAGEGGLVWVKSRSQAYDHNLFDTERGVSKKLVTNSTDAEGTISGVTSFNSDGFTLGDSPNVDWPNFTYAYWTFRKAEKFFDVVTYTGNGVAGRTVAHNLGSTPAVMIFKRTDASSGNWPVYVSSLGATALLRLNITNASFTSSDYFNDTAPTDSSFTVGDSSNINASGGSYVAYLFASDAGGFGDDGDESIIKCGSFTADGNGAASVNLGFEPQWILHKTSSTGGSWAITDIMRGMPATGSNTSQRLEPNSSLAEETRTTRYTNINSTGFNVDSPANSTSIYIAIRRPMKTPESGAEVFAMDYGTSGGFVSGFPVDTAFFTNQATTFGNYPFDRLRGVKYLEFNSTASEGTDSFGTFDSNTSWYGNIGSQYLSWMFKRATGFFDVVAYTGNGSGAGQVINHNLGATPEIIIIKGRSNSNREWHTYVSSQGQDKALFINSNGAEQANTALVGGTINPTQYELKVDFGNVNGNGETYISYLFATLAGVSKVGSYTGTGSNVDVDCGFSAGARFILIKRTSGAGDWYVYDSERGIVAGNDPYLLLNTTAAEVTNTDYIDPLSSGFTIASSVGNALNDNGSNYIFLAIA